MRIRLKLSLHRRTQTLKGSGAEFGGCYGED